MSIRGGAYVPKQNQDRYHSNYGPRCHYSFSSTCQFIGTLECELQGPCHTTAQDGYVAKCFSTAYKTEIQSANNLLYEHVWGSNLDLESDLDCYLAATCHHHTLTLEDMMTMVISSYMLGS